MVSESDARGASIRTRGQTGIACETVIDERGTFIRALGGPRSATARRGALKELVAEHFGVAV